MKSACPPSKVQLSGLPYSNKATTHRHRLNRNSGGTSSLLTRAARYVGATVAKMNPLRRRGEEPEPNARGGRQEETQAGATIWSAGSSSEVHATVDTVLQPGDVLRDQPFFTNSSEVAFFSTHPSLCADIFGFEPGEIVEFTRDNGGAVFGQLVFVVGARGGKLYVLGYGEHCARALHIPAVPVPVERDNISSNDVRAAVLTYYDGRIVSQPTRPLTSAEETQTNQPRGVLLDLVELGMRSAAVLNEQQQELTARIARLRADAAALQTRAAAEAQRVYTAEQRAFLQCAPDLYVAALPSQDNGNNEGGATTPASERNAQSTTRTSPSRQNRKSERSRATATCVSSCTSVYAAVAHGDAAARAVVLLSPRIIVATGTVGWTGEGDVELQSSQIGADGCKGSLSASVAI